MQAKSGVQELQEFRSSGVQEFRSSGVRNQESGVRSQESGVRSTPRASAREDLRRNAHSAELAVFREVAGGKCLWPGDKYWHRIDGSPTRILRRMEADEPLPALPKAPCHSATPELLQLLTSGFGRFSYRKSRRQASTEAITPMKSANRPVGIACRVFVMPTEPK